MTIETIVAIVGGVLVCGGFWTFVQFLINRRDDRKDAMSDLKDAVRKLQESLDSNNENMNLQNEALKALAQDRILYLCKCYLKQNWIYDDDLSSLKRMANAYRDLGGNDLVKTEMQILDIKINDGSLKVKTR